MRTTRTHFTATLCTVMGIVLSGAFSAAQTPTAPATMKAVRVEKFGGPEVLILADIAKPTPSAGEVLIRVEAAGVNPVDWKLRQGLMGARGPQPPFIAGFDVSGVVESAAPDVKDFKPGDEVFAYLPIGRGGGYAEFVAVAATAVAKKPAKADHLAAAGVPLAGLTAWQALFEQANLQPGQSVLIHAGAGGVGHFAVQFAKAKGAKVYATASVANQDFLKKLGADVAIDYKTQKFEEVAKDMDLVLDMIGGDTLARSYEVVKKGGTLVSIVAMPDQAKCKELGITGKVFLVHPDGKQLAEIAALIDDGKVVPHVDSTFPLAEAGKAQEKSKQGHAVGKIVLKVR